MDTKTAAVSIVVIDDKTIEAIIHNIAAMAQIQTSSMSEFADGADPAPQPPVVLALLAHRCAAVFDAANWDKL
jgi:hypothetical protein